MEAGLIQEFKDQFVASALVMDDSRVLLGMGTYARVQMIEWDFNLKNYKENKNKTIKCWTNTYREVALKKMVRSDNDIIGMYGREVGKLDPYRVIRTDK